MHPAQIKLAKAQVADVLDALDHFLDDDERLKLDMIEGETTLVDVVRALLEANEEDEGLIPALDEQVEARKARKDRAKLRIERRKAAIASLMDVARLTKLPLPEATLSLRTLQPRAKVSNPDELPDAFTVTQTIRKPDMEAIAAAVEQGASIPGVTMTNGGTSLTVRRK